MRRLNVSKNRLGGGAASLLGAFSVAEPVVSENPVQLAVDSIAPNPHQPRQTFDEESLDGLTQSILSNGVIQPIIVVKDGNTYVIVAGERRLRAAKQAGLLMIPVIIREFTPLQQAEIALLENIQREDLRPIEEAKAYQKLIELCSYSHDALAIRLGVSRSAVSNTLRLLKLNKPMQEAVDNGTMSAGHARALLALDNEEEREQLFALICAEGLTVRQAEKWSIAPSLDKKEKKQPHVTDAVNLNVQRVSLLTQKLGIKASIKGCGNKGTLALRYDSIDKLNMLLSLLEHVDFNKKDGNI